MASDAQINGIGAVVAIQTFGPRAIGLHEVVTGTWSRCLVPPDGSVVDAGTLRFYLGNPGDPVPNALSRSGTELASSDLAELMCTGTQAITHALIQAQVGRLLLLHAGAVSHPDTGKALVFVAEGGTGKTTLTRTLGRHYGYLTDETVGIDADNRILPYPKPLSLRTPSGWPKQETSPDALGLLHPGAPATVARMIILSRDSDLATPRVRELPLLDAITAIGPQSSSLYALPRGLHRCADLIDATGPVLEVTYAEAESLLPLAAELIGAP